MCSAVVGRVWGQQTSAEDQHESLPRAGAGFDAWSATETMSEGRGFAFCMFRHGACRKNTYHPIVSA